MIFIRIIGIIIPASGIHSSTEMHPQQAVITLITHNGKQSTLTQTNNSTSVVIKLHAHGAYPVFSREKRCRK